MMRCRKCGAEIEEWATFCRYCGTPAANAGSAAGKGKNLKKKRRIWPVVVTVLAVLLMAAGVTAAYFVFSEPEEEDTGSMKTMSGMMETKDDTALSPDEEETRTGSEDDDLSEEVTTDTGDFAVNAGVEEDYSQNLDPDQYVYYDSGISDFNFYYPADLYNDVAVSETASATDYGTRLQTVHFTGSKGSELIFEISRRTDNLSLDEMREKVYQNESGSMSDPVTILNRLSEEMTHGKVIVSGYSNAAYDMALYDMVKIEDDYVLQMKVVFPYTPEDMENNRQQNYVVDCLYRLCGFSDTSYESTRSYEEFKESLKNN